VAWEFRHATFKRDDPDAIASIKRRSVKQTNQLRLQMEAEAASKEASQRGASTFQAHGPGAQALGPDYATRPATISPPLSIISKTSPRQLPIKHSHPTDATGLNGHGSYSTPPYSTDPAGRPGAGYQMPFPASYPSYPRYPSYMPPPNPSGDVYRPVPPSMQSSSYGQPLSSASVVSQFPLGEPPVYQSVSHYNPDRNQVHALVRHVGSISNQASHLAYEQEALKQNTEELRQETGVILDSLSAADSALPDGQGEFDRFQVFALPLPQRLTSVFDSLLRQAASRLRQGIERLHDKFAEREKQVTASLANAENIVATAHAMKGSLTASPRNPMQLQLDGELFRMFLDTLS
jgi:hypothetical protein